MISSALHSRNIEYSYHQPDNPLAQCRLQWRQGQLLVRSFQDFPLPYLPSLECEQKLVECLKSSPVRLVRLEPMLGEEALQRWADACERANKPMFLLQGTAIHKFSKKSSQFASGILRIIDWILALLLLIALSPILLTIVGFMLSYSQKTIFSGTWHIGLRGKLFRAIKFHTTQRSNNIDAPSLGRWLRKYRLDEIPLLFNVLRGEMSLLGLRPLTLAEAVRLSSNDPQGMNVVNVPSTTNKVVVKA